MCPTSQHDYFWQQMDDPEYRQQYVDAQIRQTVAAQIRAMRVGEHLSQGDLAQLCETSQSVISQLESPDYGRHSITTLKKLAAAFDVALIIRFAPFSELMDWSVDSTIDQFDVPNFAEDPRHTIAPFVRELPPPDAIAPEGGTSEANLELPEAGWTGRSANIADGTTPLLVLPEVR